MVLEKQINQYTDLDSKLQLTQQELAKAQKLLAGEKQQQERAKEVETKLNSVLCLFNTQVHTGNVLAYLNWQAYKRHTFLQDLKPLQVVDKKYYFEIPFTLKVQGNYQSVVNYIQVLESLPNVSEIRRAEFRPVDNITTSLETNTDITVEIDMVIFSAKDATKALVEGKELAERWKVGRDDAFQWLEPLSPLDEMTIPYSGTLQDKQELIGNG
ncbi:hypothetical protein JCM14036_33870 [Desulfotomaculum defluvii]